MAIATIFVNRPHPLVQELPLDFVFLGVASFCFEDEIDPRRGGFLSLLSAIRLDIELDYKIRPIYVGSALEDVVYVEAQMVILLM